MEPPLESISLTDSTAFERKKWEDEIQLRNREIELKEAEVRATILAKERSRWTSPVVVAIFAAALAGMGNAVVAWINGIHQENLEVSKNNQERDIEEFKAESARILEVVKTGDPNKAAENLNFLLRVGLVTRSWTH